MLRTRLYLGLLPLLLLFFAVGLLAIWLSRDLGRAGDRELNTHYQAHIAGYQKRDAARRLKQAIRWRHVRRSTPNAHVLSGI